MAFNENNQSERLKFIDFWSKYVINHDDKDWSAQQNKIINSCLRSSNMDKELYLKMKQDAGIKRNRKKARDRKAER